MNVMRSLLIAGLVVLAPLSVCMAEPRQDAPRPGGRAASGNSPVVTPFELERWFDSYVLLQAQDTLRLTDGQFPRFLPRLRALQETRRRNLQARRQILNTLGRLLKSTPFDETQSRDQLKALRDLDAKAAEDLRKVYEALDEVLDAGQQARFRVFEELVERRKIDLLMRARQRAGDAGKPGPSGVR
jgi:Spy/CpxP family protein refolding chaperone